MKTKAKKKQENRKSQETQFKKRKNEKENKKWKIKIFQIPKNNNNKNFKNQSKFFWEKSKNQKSKNEKKTKPPRCTSRDGSTFFLKQLRSKTWKNKKRNKPWTQDPKGRTPPLRGLTCVTAQEFWQTSFRLTWIRWVARSCTTTAYRWLSLDSHPSLGTLWSAVIKSPLFFLLEVLLRQCASCKRALVILVRMQISQFRSFGKWVWVGCFLVFVATFVRAESESWELCNSVSSRLSVKSYNRSGRSANGSSEFFLSSSYYYFEKKKNPHVIIGILLFKITKSERGCKHGKKCFFRHVEADESPAKIPRKVVRKDQLRCWWNLQNWVVYLKIIIRENLFHVNMENWDRSTPSNSPRAPGTKLKFGKERVHR